MVKDYNEIETLETYVKALTVLLAILSLVVAVLILLIGQSLILGIICGLLIFAVGYMGICALRVFAGIARDIRDMRNRGC